MVVSQRFLATLIGTNGDLGVTEPHTSHHRTGSVEETC